jgi:ELWxxDGT repeat protein
VNTGKIINITNIGSRLLITTGFDDHDYGYHAFVLWQSDGTGAGTTEIRTFHPRLADTPPYGFTLLNDTIYFGADDQGSGTELWQSDGTKDGTRIVHEIGVGSANGLPEWDYIQGTPSVDNQPPDGTFEAALLGKQLLFTASDGRDGLTLWRTDGSDSGTVQMLQGSPGSASSMPDPLLAEVLAVGDRVLFLANDGAHGTEWWSSNGTNSGTMLLKDINSSLSGSMYGPTVIGDRMYFQATTEQGYHLWVSDGTGQGTTPVNDDTAEQMLIRAIAQAGDGAQMSAIPYVMANIGGTVYYYTVDPEYSDQRALFLWRSDGSSVGAQKVI